ncbi:MAG: hypothetical protein ABIK83_02375 [Candidatus Zixiibacteriota bacterium]
MGELRLGLLTMTSLYLCILACAAGTSMHSRTAPNREERVFHKILLMTTYSDIELDQAFEKKVKGCLKSHKAECVHERELFFPAGNYDFDEFVQKADSAGIDAILFVSPGSSGVSEQYIPKSSTTTTSGSVSSNGWFNAKSKTREYGGYSVGKPWTTTGVELYDYSTGEVIWVASAKTGGNAFAKWTTVVRSLGGQLVEKLGQDGLIE